jgi:hypothetical protein
MSSIKGPTGVGSVGVDAVAPAQTERVRGPAFAAHVEAARAQSVGGASYVEQLATEVSAGRMTALEAVDVLVEAAASPEMEPAQRNELRQMLTDLIANDPHFEQLMRGMQ